MPLYEYECDACGRRFEKIQKFSDPPVDTCPTCGGTVRKLIASPAFQFKGTGWYITDYARKDNARPKTDENGGSKTDAPDKESGSADKDAGAKKESAKTEAAAPSSSGESSASPSPAAAPKPSTKD